MCLPQWKRAFSFAMPCQGWSLHLQKALHASCKMKIISLPIDYITLPLLHGLPLLLIELRGVGAPHFNTRGPYSGPSGSSLINTNHPQGRGWGLQRCFNLTLAHQVLSQPQQPPTGESEGFKDVLTSAFIGLRFTTKLLFWRLKNSKFVC